MATETGTTEMGTKDSRLERITIPEGVRGEISRSETANEHPVVLAVYNGQNFLGYKTDSGWDLAQDKFKVHPLQDARPEGRLARTLLYFFKMSLQGSPGTENSWMKRLRTARIVVESLSSTNFGEKLLEYKIKRKGDGYEVLK